MFASPIASSLKNPQPTARGFTLLETMVVLAVLAVLATIAVPDLSPAVHRARHRGASEELVAFLERARREARAEGRCHRVKMSGNSLIMQERATADCSSTDVLDEAGWNAPKYTLNPPLSVFFQLDSLPAPALPGDEEVVFRPNGRVRGNNNLDITDDGARLVVGYQPLGSERWVVIVTTAGRIGGFRYPAPPGDFTRAIFPGLDFGAAGTTDSNHETAMSEIPPSEGEGEGEGEPHMPPHSAY